MKYIFIIFIALPTLCVSQSVFAIDYKDIISITQNPKEPNTTSNINRAKLLCTHVGNFRNNVGDISDKYDLDSDLTIMKTINLVKKMHSACNKIQTLDIEKSHADEVITSIVEDLSVLNDGIKLHLKSEIKEINKQHERYGLAAGKVAYHLDILSEKLEKRIYSKPLLDDRDKQILKHIARLKKISRKLTKFGDLEFYKKSEMQASLLRIIKEIKKEIQNIRDL